MGIFKAERPIAYAQTVSLGTIFYNQDIPRSHVILFYCGLVLTETIAPIPGGQLGYINPDDSQINIAKLHISQPFYWPTNLVLHDLPPDYQADLQAPLEGPEAGDFEEYNDGSDDIVTCNTRKALNQSRKSMAKRYSKHYEIDEFVAGDIVALKLPKGARTTTDMRRIFGRILSVPHNHRYEVQTEYGVLDRLLPTRELMRVPKSLANSIPVIGPKKRVSMKKVGEEASTSERVIISCKCKGLCATNRCRCFKEKKKCSVHCHDSAEHDCGFLASLALRTELAIIAKPLKGSLKGTKRQRANTAGEHIKK